MYCAFWSYVNFINGHVSLFLMHSDGDGIGDLDDNCVLSPNSDQSDIDGDGTSLLLFVSF